MIQTLGIVVNEENSFPGHKKCFAHPRYAVFERWFFIPRKHFTCQCLAGLTASRETMEVTDLSATEDTEVPDSCGHRVYLPQRPQRGLRPQPKYGRVLLNSKSEYRTKEFPT